jgi:hypothetical protein
LKGSQLYNDLTLNPEIKIKLEKASKLNELNNKNNVDLNKVVENTKILFGGVFDSLGTSIVKYAETTKDIDNKKVGEGILNATNFIDTLAGEKGTKATQNIGALNVELTKFKDTLNGLDADKLLKFKDITIENPFTKDRNTGEVCKNLIKGIVFTRDNMIQDTTTEKNIQYNDKTYYVEDIDFENVKKEFEEHKSQLQNDEFWYYTDKEQIKLASYRFLQYLEYNNPTYILMHSKIVRVVLSFSLNKEA